MKFIENINESDYTEFVSNHPKSHFLQSYEWGQFSKISKSMIPHYVGIIDDNNKLVGAALLLQRKLPFGYNYYYSPRGYVIDYNNHDLLKIFTSELRTYLKKNKGIFLTIDPDIKYQDIDESANPIKDGYNNYDLFNYLIDLGYKHKGFNKLFEGNQPRYTFRIDLTTDEKKSSHQFDSSFMKSVKKSYSYDLDIIINDDVKRFHELIHEVAEKDDFAEYSYEYYQNFYDIFKKNHNVKMYSVQVNPKELLENRLLEIERLQKILDRETTKEGQRKETEFVLEHVKKKMELFEPYKDNGNMIIASLIVVYYGNKAWSLYLGSNSLAKETFAGNRLYYEFIEDIKKSDKYYIVDLFGTVGDPNTKYKNLKGIHAYKQKFGGEYTEFLGDFDLIGNKFMYNVFPKVLKVYRFLKNIKKGKK